MGKVKTLMKIKTLGVVVLYVASFLGFWACEDDPDPTINDPSVSIFFLNKDSLGQVNVIVDSLDAELDGFDTVITNLKTSADLLVDSLITLTDSIANGGDLKEDSATVRNDLDTLNVYLTGVEKEDSAANANRTEWSDVASTINSGSLLVTSIQNTKNGLLISYEDSSTSWRLPLDMQADDIDVNITIAKQVYKLGLAYSRSTTTDEKNKVIIRTADFGLLQTTFDSTNISCSNCEDVETTIYVEF